MALRKPWRSKQYVEETKMLNIQTLALWNKIKHHLSDNGLLDVLQMHPELREEIEQIRQFRPVAIQNATRMGDKMVGSIVNYVGKDEYLLKWISRQTDKKVTVVETPLVVAMDGDVCFEMNDGSIFQAPNNDLKFN
jgi:hypothetical protein